MTKSKIQRMYTGGIAAAAAAVGAVDPSGSSGTVGGACLPVPIHDSDGGVRS